MRVSGYPYLSFCKGLEDRLLDAACVLCKTHVLQHHDRAQQQSGWVSKPLAGNIRGGSVDSLKDGALVTNVSRWSKTQTTDQTSAQIGQNVTVQVGHDQDLVVVWNWVGDHLQTGVVEHLGVKLDIGVFLGDVASEVQEETVGHLHDGSLVDNTDLWLADILCVLESEAQDTLRSLASDELDGLDNAVDHNVLDTTVLSFGVLTDQDSVYVVVWGLVSCDALARSNVCEKVEGSSEGEVERDVTLADGRGKRTFEGDVVASDTVNSLVWDDSLAVLEGRCNVHWFPLDRDVGGRVDVLD